jgi:hypothetical protein
MTWSRRLLVALIAVGSFGFFSASSGTVLAHEGECPNQPTDPDPAAGGADAGGGTPDGGGATTPEPAPAVDQDEVTLAGPSSGSALT